MSRYQILHEGRNGRNKVGIFDNQEPAKYDGKEIVRRSMTMEETRDRLNALEAERDALLVRAKAYERLIDSAGYDVRVLTGYEPLGGGDG